MTTNVASFDSSLRGSSLEPKIMYFVLFNNKMLYFALRAFVFLITNINIKITIFYSPPRLSFSILSLLFHFSFIQLPAVFAPYFSPFPSLPLSLISPQVFDLLRHLLHLLSLFSFRPIPVLSLLVPTSASRHHFSLLHTLSPLPIVLRFSYCLSSLLLICVVVPLPFYSPSPCTFSRRVVFFFSPSSRKCSSVSPLSHPI
jgi:hypothetical protein